MTKRDRQLCEYASEELRSGAVNDFKTVRPQSDIVNRLLDRSYSGKAKDPLCEEAADEISRLRWKLQIRENIISRLIHSHLQQPLDGNDPPAARD
jgi:hypothetical protein